jgi:hypothetical protein
MIAKLLLCDWVCLAHEPGSHDNDDSLGVQTQP